MSFLAKYLPVENKGKKRKTKKLNIVDDEITGFVPIVDDEDAPVVVQDIKGAGWKVVGEEEFGREIVVGKQSRKSHISYRNRRSPSPYSNRRSPSPSPTRDRRSPSPSPTRDRKSPSPSPTATDKDLKRARKSPSPSPEPRETGSELVREQELDKQTSGRDAETIYRDKMGKKIDLVAEKAEQLKRKRQKEQEEEELMEWGKGIVQKREKEEYLSRLEAEKDAKFSFYANDEKRNQIQREKERWGDPMAFMVKDKPKTNVIRGPPNRFGIPPGREWDGVDRSNGFEIELFQQQHKSKVLREEYHQWSTEDM